MRPDEATPQLYHRSFQHSHDRPPFGFAQRSAFLNEYSISYLAGIVNIMSFEFIAPTNIFFVNRMSYKTINGYHHRFLHLVTCHDTNARLPS
jgi:hypothetical protein